MNLSGGVKKILITAFLVFAATSVNYAGPPFVTDDPEPVDYKHWEFYTASVNTMRSDIWSGTSPHVEVNYGLVPDVQVHLLLPLNYNYYPKLRTDFGYGNTEMGVKFRFIHETKNMPQIGIFPIIQIPTVRNSEFSNGKAQLFLPVWVQKSWNKLTTYGGTGYCINPGKGNKNWILAGGEVQYDFSEHLMLGGECYFHSADTEGGKPVTAFNLGGSVNFTEYFHFIFSFGHSMIHDSFFSSYLGLLWTI